MENDLKFYASALKRLIGNVEDLVSAKQPAPKKLKEEITALVLVTSLFKHEMKKLTQVK